MDDMEQNQDVEIVIAPEQEENNLSVLNELEQVEVSLEPEGVSETEEIVEDKPKKQKGRPDGLMRIKQLSRDKYHAEYVAKTKEEENQKLREEVERLKVLSEQNSQAAMGHFDDSVKRQMEQARFRMTKAIQEGDVEEQLKATEELAEAKARQLQIESWNATRNYENQQKQVSQREEKPYIEQKQVEIPLERQELPEEAHEWIRNNAWVDPHSAEFDEGLAREVQAYESVLFNRYQRTGQQNKIFSKQYFDEIDRYIKQDIYGEEPIQQAKRTLNMKPNRAPVAPVSNSRPTQQNSMPKFKLPPGMTEAEFKNFIHNMGIKESDYMKEMKNHLLDQQNNFQQAMRQGRI